MSTQIRKRSSVAGVAALTIALVGFGAVPAFATNPGTESGDNSSECNVVWNTEAILSEDANKIPEDLHNEGEKFSYANSGYVSEVAPSLEGAGIFEMNHFNIPQSKQQVWRIPTATDRTILNATVTFTLPEEVADQDVTFDAVSSNAKMTAWNAPYSNYAWTSEKAQAIDNEDGTWTVDLGDLTADEGTVYQFNVQGMDEVSDTWREDAFTASAELTGTYMGSAEEDAQCGINVPEPPTATPDLGECQVEFIGVTRWDLDDKDITDRTKIHDGEESDLVGEVNSDGWGVGADGWKEGATRTFRHYAATSVELTDATYTIDAVQGHTFTKVSATASTPGGGALQGNGYTEEVEGVTITPSEDGTQIVVHVDHMPANSSLSFNATGVIDDSGQPLFVHHRLIGEQTDCEPVGPEVPEEPTPGEPTPVDPDAPAEPETPEKSGVPVSSEQLAKTGSEQTVLPFAALGMILAGLAVSAVALRRRFGK
ncbi:MAG: LPXTG cell wall anchor domain-containing protein [Canibacter sp.]